ncbi:MAG: hypothetical protein HY329_23715 [Chloroflexi bacterium]|nr:hypothetical protein [Chloroflexota bacterium]
MTASSWLWRSLLVGAAVLLFLGGPLHPKPDPGVSFEAASAKMLADPGWVPSHGLMLATHVLLAFGFFGLTRRVRLSGAARIAGWFAVVGAALSAIEMSFHLGAVVELDALVAGRPTPIFLTHLVLATLAQPLLGFSVAALAVLGARRRGVIDLVIGLIGAIGGLAHGLAAPIVVATRDQSFSFLFPGVVLLTPWLLWIAARSMRSTRTSTDLEPASLAPQP